MIQQLDIGSITLDEDLQPRAQIHEDVLLEYGHMLAGGAEFPPVIVFDDGATLWLADGYHRCHAHKAIERNEISADVMRGSKRDALRFSLAANASHGLRRSAIDFRRAYTLAVEQKLANSADTNGIAALLNCSERWARELTREAREARDAERDAAIIEARMAGTSLRDAARKAGVSYGKAQSTDRKRKASVCDQIRLFEPTLPLGWSQVLYALDQVGDLPPIDDLFPADLDVLKRAMDKFPMALAWMKAFAGKLADPIT